MGRALVIDEQHASASRFRITCKFFFLVKSFGFVLSSHQEAILDRNFFLSIVVASLLL